MNFQTNRKNFFNLMEDNSIAIISSGSQKKRSNDTYFPFRQENNFYYLTGFKEDSAVLVMKKTALKQEMILFVHPKDPLKEMWEGKRLGLDLSKELFVCDQTFSIEDFDVKIKDLFLSTQVLYCQTNKISKKIFAIIAQAKEGKSGHLYPHSFKDIDFEVQKLRRKKQAYEITAIKAALAITQKAHHAAMSMAAPSKYEYELMALVEYIFKSGGASWDAYTTIVAGGNNANTLHYTDNSHRLVDGELILMDAGSEFALYASDITRCFPVNGRFSTAQKELYEIVLTTQKSVIAEIKPGVLRSDIGNQAVKLLSQGLKDIKLLDQSLDEIIDKELYKPYYPHGIGHWMGLDVHDPIAYKDAKDKEFTFEVGDVLTIEPGLYLNSSDSLVPDAFKGIGIRIEDNILVTKTGYENLSQGIVKEITEIEAMSEKSIYDYI